MESAPIYQCFYAGYIIWKFFVIPEISSGQIVTAYGRPGRTVDESCPKLVCGAWARPRQMR